jgi:MinD-like ATPase involved in chromosome partitioning or flagellar assembly
MEPVTLTAIGTAILTLLATKALEKTGENLGDKIFEEGSKLLSLLKRKFPNIASSIELADRQPLNYPQAVTELQEAAKDSEVAKAILKLEASVNGNPSSRLAQEIRKIADNLNSSQPNVVNYSKLAENIKNVFQGNNFNGVNNF